MKQIWEFKCPDNRLTHLLVEEVRMTGLFRTPLPLRSVRTGPNRLIIERDDNRSAMLHVPWYVERHGLPVLTTATLSPGFGPHCLPLEIARGTLAQLRNQLAEWQQAGLTLTDRITESIRDATQLMRHASELGHELRAACLQASRDPAAKQQTAKSQAAEQQADLAERDLRELLFELSDRSVRATLEAGRHLADHYTERAFAARRRTESRFPVRLSVGFTPELATPDLATHDDSLRRLVSDAFHSVVIPVDWRRVEPVEGQFDWTEIDRQFDWARKSGLSVIAGPLITPDFQCMPEYLDRSTVIPDRDQGRATDDPEPDSQLLYTPSPLASDIPDAAFAVARYFDAFTERYVDRIESLIGVGRMNIPTGLCPSNAALVELTALYVEMLIERLPDHVPLLVSIDQPWAEYTAQLEDEDEPGEDDDSHGWELRTDTPDDIHRVIDTSDPRLLADSLIRRSGRLIDGLVLEVNVAHHCLATKPRPPLEFVRHLDHWQVWDQKLLISLCVPSSTRTDPLAELKLGKVPGRWTERIQQEWIHRYIPLMLTRPNIQGIIWNQLTDSVEHRFPNAGLLDADDQPKPAFRKLTSLRKAFLL